MKRLMILLVGLLVLAGCAEKKPQKMVPEWVHGNSLVAGKIAAVGVGTPDLRGENVQRMKALMGAFSQIAALKGTSIKGEVSFEVAGTREGTTAQIHSASVMTIDDRKITAKVRGIWRDPATEEMYYWLVAD